MADNVAITAGSGTAIAADDVSGVMYQKVKLDLGGDGVSDPVETTLPVSGEVAITDTYAPIGSHSSGALISSAITLTKPEGANSILIQTLVQNVRFTLDGTTPTASVGFQILAGNPPMIIAIPGTSIKVIEETASASLQYQWIG